MVAQALRDSRVPTPVRDLGLPVQFLHHGRRSQLLDELGLTAQEISRGIVETMARLDAPLSESPSQA
jgi:1-deoxy-D-xylulose-5-phosphate synthase